MKNGSRYHSVWSTDVVLELLLRQSKKMSAPPIDKSKFLVQKALDEAQVLFDSLMQEYFG